MTRDSISSRMPLLLAVAAVLVPTLWLLPAFLLDLKGRRLQLYPHGP